MNLAGFRTIAVALAIGALGAAEQADWTNVVGEGNTGLVMLVIAVLMGALRGVTTTSIFQTHQKATADQIKVDKAMEVYKGRK